MNAPLTENRDEEQQELSFTSMKYSEFRVIIADEQHTFASLMRTILQSMGFTSITIALNGEEALKICSYSKFDIYLFDYSFTSGISGLDLVQKLREEHLAPCMSLMFIITGDPSRSKVLCAVEHEPDDYIIKPFSQQQFAERIKKAITKKIALRDVYTCMHRDDDAGTVKALEKALTEGTQYDVYCRCLLADYYVKTEQMNLAQAVIQEGMVSSNSDYLKFAMGKILYSMNMHEESISIIKDVLTRRPLMTDAIEYVSKNYISMGRSDEAIQNIKHAVELSPLSEKLLNVQVSTAIEAGDFLTARDGVGSLLNIKKNSPHDVDNLLESFAECEFMFAEQSRDPFHISNIEKVLGNIASRYQNCVSKQTFSPDVFRTICEARISLIRGEIHKSKKKLYQLLPLLHDKDKEISDSLKKGMYLGFMAIGEYEVAAQIAEDLPESEAHDISNHILDCCLSRKNTEQAERRSKYQELNSQGIDKYNAGNLTEALDLFKEAIRKVPGNTNAILNKIQVLIDLAEQQLRTGYPENKKRARSLIIECSSDMSLLDGITLSEVQEERARLLRKDYAETEKKVVGK